MTGALSAGGGHDRFTLGKDQIVQEFGFDDDVDDAFRSEIEERIGAPLEDEDYTGEVDACVLWWRADDGDLTDALVDLVGLLEGDAFIALLTPRHGVERVEASEIEEAAGAAGLHASGTFNVSDVWHGVKLAPARSDGRR